MKELLKKKINELKQKVNEFNPTKERWCALAQAVYHVIFASAMFGGGSYYLAEFQKTRDMVVQQVDRVEQMSQEFQESMTKNIENATSTVKKSSKAVNKSAKAIKKTGDDVKDALDQIKDKCGSKFF